MSYYKRTTCRLCESTQLSNALHYPPQPLADEYLPVKQRQRLYPLDLYLCEECGCAQLLDVVSGDAIYPHYTYETGSSPALVNHFKRYAIDLDNRIKPLQKSLIIDIGSNDGTFLRNFDNLRVLGVDPAPVKSSAETIRAFFTPALAAEILHQHGPASIITANNVYANIDDLRTFTEAARNLLTFDGVFVFETFYLADLIDHNVWDFIYHEHLSAFAVSPLVGFFQRLGMQIFDVQRVATKGGSIRVYVQLDSGKRPVSPNVPAMVEWEYLRRLHDKKTFHAFGSKVTAQCSQIKQCLAGLSGIIAGYGASPTSTTLIYTAGIGNNLEFLIDDWVPKHNTFSPGRHLPVYGWADLKDVDYCVILAWRYAEEIMARNPQYRGKWIVPLPELKICG